VLEYKIEKSMRFKKLFDKDEQVKIKSMVAAMHASEEAVGKSPEDLTFELTNELEELLRLRKAAKQLTVPKRFLDSLRERIAVVKGWYKNIKKLSKKTGETLSSHKQEMQEAIGALKESIAFRDRFERFLDAFKQRRRSMLKWGVGAAGAAGAAYLGGKAIQKLMGPLERPEKEVQQPAPEPEPPVEISYRDVQLNSINKTIGTEGSYANATYIVVIPHSTELNALVAARKACTGPITYVTGNHDRNLKIKTRQGVVEIDPNNTFSEIGIKKSYERIYHRKWDAVRQSDREKIAQSCKLFTDEISKRIFQGKMVLALHTRAITLHNLGLMQTLSGR